MEPILCKKKVTTIVDEYYKIPRTTNGTNGTTNGELYKVPPETYIEDELSTLYPPGNPAMFDRTTFTDSIISYYDSYAKKMQDLITASSGPDDELTTFEENAFRDLWAIGTLLRPLYSAEFCERLTHQLRAMVLIEIQLISFARLGWDTKQWTDRISNFPVTDMSNLLATYNNNFDRDTVKTYWLNVTDAWLSAIKARVAKDTATFENSIKKANDNIRSFASYFAQGVIQQHADKFIEPSAL